MCGIFPTVSLGFQVFPYICESVDSRIGFYRGFVLPKGPKLKDLAVSPLLEQGGEGTATVKEVL